MTTTTRRNRAPTHPGELLREDVLPAAGLTVVAAARRLGVSRQYLHRVLAGTAPVRAPLALALAGQFGGSAEAWMNMQSAHDLWQARRGAGSGRRRERAALP